MTATSVIVFHTEASRRLDCKTVRIFTYSSTLYARTVKQKLKTERENWGGTLKIRTVRFEYDIFVRIAPFSQPRAIPIG